MKRHTIIGANILYSAVADFRGGNFLAMASVIARSRITNVGRAEAIQRGS